MGVACGCVWAAVCEAESVARILKTATRHVVVWSRAGHSVDALVFVGEGSVIKTMHNFKITVNSTLPCRALS